MADKYRSFLFNSYFLHNIIVKISKTIICKVIGKKAAPELFKSITTDIKFEASTAMRADKINRNWSSHIVLRYTFFQLPGIFLIIVILTSLRMMFGIPLWSVWTFIALWIVKDIILFPFVWHAYDKRDTGALGSLLGSQGRALERLSPEGYVKVRGELWRAELDDRKCPVDAGEEIEIIGLHRSTLRVRRSTIRSE
jgi:membrane protein implicated in regulation of membrane protease activity